MIEKSATEMQFVSSREPIPTVEVDMDSIPKDFYGYSDLVVRALQPVAEASPKIRATVYVYQGKSENFHEQTWSAFIGVSGNDRKLLPPLLAAFEEIDGVRAKFSDYIDPSKGICEFHIQDGKVWRQIDASNWYAGEDETQLSTTPETLPESNDVVNDSVDNSDEISSSIRSARYRAARADASVGRIKKTIEEIFGLPEGSVALCDKNGNHLRADATIATLRRRWE